MDAIFIGGIAVFLALTWGLVVGCKKLEERK
ncbi:potassium ABC transporter ATPase [Glaciimonas sp. GS1]|uniref:Potassium ABC transporter ATPase n=1 Tax=Glaciimonas soli TaxID=2590999 RepID=A0A843YVM6_9BURK|nr:potassium ABC transporter ATPase [Glaciimonas soli]